MSSNANRAHLGSTWRARESQSPCCEIEIGNEAHGSMLTLRTIREVLPGESLTITYLDSEERTLPSIGLQSA